MTLSGSCHCGKTQFEVPHAPEEVVECNCSYCSKHGVLWADYAPAEFKLLTPAEDGAIYRWNSGALALHFCPNCGGTTFSSGPDLSADAPDPTHPDISINARLLNDFDLGSVPVRQIDGKNLW